MSLLRKGVDVMEITNEVYNSVNKYFSVLQNMGYKSYNEVGQLIVFTFIEEMLSGPLSQYITERDYTYIANSLDCLYGTCMIPFPDYKKAIDRITRRLPDEYRVTEDIILRQTQSLDLRVKS